MKKEEVIARIINQQEARPEREQAEAFAPTNIALCKYWGKRDGELNLPLTSSLSLSLGQKGATCTLKRAEGLTDLFRLNGKVMPLASPFGQRLSAYLDLFRGRENCYFEIEMQMNIP
ncbi:MAG TPA: diphosphomevalonate decarboxylase, partial [Gammaproteobacteria bacterium]|nr:diphosphomevalonate decarboxylase [Gammaproteobacteria bacterium]